MATRWRRPAGALGGAALIAGADQLSKTLATQAMDGPVRLWGNYLRLRLASNTGGAFGLFSDYGGVLTVVTGAVILGLLVVVGSGRVRAPVALGGLSAILGGALGNAIDRVRLGHVVDFIDVGLSPTLRWPTFNVADMAIVVGTGLVIGHLLREESSP